MNYDGKDCMFSRSMGGKRGPGGTDQRVFKTKRSPRNKATKATPSKKINSPNMWMP